MNKKNKLQNPKLTTVPFHNSNTIPKMLKPFENLNLIVLKDVCVSNPKKQNKTFDINVNEKFQDVWVLKTPLA